MPVEARHSSLPSQLALKAKHDANHLGKFVMKITFTETEQTKKDFFQAALTEHDLRFPTRLSAWHSPSE
jgi:hypothetical protein